MPLFSIIIPVYNVSSYLVDALESVLSQSCRDWECVCVNDGSTDDSGEILDSYASRDSRFRVIHQENGGVSAARNAGLALACGELVLFLDADDLLLDDALGILRVFVESHPDVELVQFGHRQRGIDYCAKFDCCVESEEFFASGGLPTSSVWGLLLRRTIFTGIMFPIGIRVAEDSEYSVRCHFRACVIGQVAKALYEYRVNPVGVIHSGWTFEKVRDLVRVIGRLSGDIVIEGEQAAFGFQRILERMRLSFFQALYHLENRNEVAELLAAYETLPNLLPAQTRPLRLAERFPWLYFAVLKWIRRIPK
jgi:glycosyltransferase involved in cell wall biosynthesis